MVSRRFYFLFVSIIIPVLAQPTDNRGIDFFYTSENQDNFGVELVSGFSQESNEARELYDVNDLLSTVNIVNGFPCVYSVLQLRRSGDTLFVFLACLSLLGNNVVLTINLESGQVKRTSQENNFGIDFANGKLFVLQRTSPRVGRVSSFDQTDDSVVSYNEVNIPDFPGGIAVGAGKVIVIAREGNNVLGSGLESFREQDQDSGPIATVSRGSPDFLRIQVHCLDVEDGTSCFVYASVVTRNDGTDNESTII